MSDAPNVKDFNASQYTFLDDRDISAIQNPRPMVIVGSHDGRLTGFASIIWCTPISHDPALIAFALRDRSYTLNMLLNTRTFSLSFLEANEESIKIAEFCGYKSGYNVNKALTVPHNMVEVRAQDVHTGHVPIVDNALSWMTCRVDSTQRAGDHTLVIGQVLEAATRSRGTAASPINTPETLLCLHHHIYGEVKLISSNE